MRTITREIKLFKFEELSEKSQQKVIEKFSQYASEWGWWEYVYEQAKDMGFKIGSFDLERAEIDIESKKPMKEITEFIKKNYNNESGFYEACDVANDGIEALSVDCEDEECEEIEEEFNRSIGCEFLKMLQDELDYKQSKEAILETIEANEYEFNEEGGIEYAFEITTKQEIK